MKNQDQSFNLALSIFANMLSVTEQDQSKKEELKKCSNDHFDNYKKENNKSETVVKH